MSWCVIPVTQLPSFVISELNVSLLLEQRDWLLSDWFTVYLLPEQWVYNASFSICRLGEDIQSFQVKRLSQVTSQCRVARLLIWSSLKSWASRPQSDSSPSHVTQVHTSGNQYYFSIIFICIRLIAVLSSFAVVIKASGCKNVWKHVADIRGFSFSPACQFQDSLHSYRLIIWVCL